MGNSKLANGCQVPTGPAPDADGLLSRVPGQHVAEASLTLPDPAPGQHAEAEIDAGHVGRVRIFFEVKTARRGKHSHQFWAAYRAEPIHGGWDSDVS
ncbi:hypothetical protein CURE108131_23285 [Cupriavidus respiraculi]|uniref:Uncharacterized protein n=1 Tax=Cupriavidus respiraculi TaxID=195930 RepID=A0ABM8WXS0_9BURK|nr:hypothetical protein LMG21510_01939 [Cupriavidus respiraculi]